MLPATLRSTSASPCYHSVQLQIERGKTSVCTTMGKHGMESTWTFAFGWFTWSWSVVLSRGKGNDTCRTAGACVQMLCVHLQHQQGWWGGHGGLKVLSLLSIDHVTLFRHKALQQTTHPLIREQKRYSTVTTFQQHGFRCWQILNQSSQIPPICFEVIKYGITKKTPRGVGDSRSAWQLLCLWLLDMTYGNDVIPLFIFSQWTI